MSVKRHTDLKPQSYVLTAREVASLYFRRSGEYLGTKEFRDAYPTFPNPRSDGLYHRASVEAWVDSTFGITAGTHHDGLKAHIMEAAKHGARSRETRSRS